MSKVCDGYLDNREMAEKLLDAKDMEYEMTRQEEQDEMDNILNEVNAEFQGHLEQLQSDIEDLNMEIAYWKEQVNELKEIIKYTNSIKSNKLND